MMPTSLESSAGGGLINKPKNKQKILAIKRGAGVVKHTFPLKAVCAHVSILNETGLSSGFKKVPCSPFDRQVEWYQITPWTSNAPSGFA